MILTLQSKNGQAGRKTAGTGPHYIRRFRLPAEPKVRMAADARGEGTIGGNQNIRGLPTLMKGYHQSLAGYDIVTNR